MSDHPIFAKLLKYIFKEGPGKNNELKVNKNLCGAKDAACIWHKLIKQSSAKAKLRKLETALSISMMKGMIVIAYVDDILMFTEQQSKLNPFKQKLEQESFFEIWDRQFNFWIYL